MATTKISITGSLVLFRPGGRNSTRIPDVNNFFNIKASASYHTWCLFLKIIWQQFNITCHCLRYLTFRRQPHFFAAANTVFCYILPTVVCMRFLYWVEKYTIRQCKDSIFILSTLVDEIDMTESLQSSNRIVFLKRATV